MKEQIEAKLKQAQEQQAQWQLHVAQAQQRLVYAQEQVSRWDAIRLFCEELLAQKKGEHEGEHEEQRNTKT